MGQAEFARIREVRMKLRDPIGVNDLIYSDDMPQGEPDPQAAYYVADLGNYQRFNERKKAWERLPTKLSDPYILEVLEKKGPVWGPIALVDYIIMGLQAGAVSFSAGAESVSLPSLRETLEFYQAQKKLLIDEAGGSVGRALRTPRPDIGGVRERW